MRRPAAGFARLALLTVLAAVLPATAAPERATTSLGLCPADARQRDAFTRALCEGESALGEGRVGAALENFRLAAELPRPAATHELAWAGLAAAHCRAGEFDDGRRWAAYFAEARRLWGGELDCMADGRAGRAAPGPFVRSRMCGDALAADYATVRANPQAAFALDLQARLRRIDEAIAAACAQTPAGAAPATPKAPDAKAGKSAPKKPRKQGKGSRDGAGTPATKGAPG